MKNGIHIDNKNKTVTYVHHNEVVTKEHFKSVMNTLTIRLYAKWGYLVPQIILSSGLG